MSWRQLAEERLHGHGTEDIRDDRDKTPPIRAIVSTVPIVPPVDHGKLPTDAEARVILRDWHGRLSALDPDAGPDGFDPRRWRRIVEDARWLYTAWGSQLAREGWSALDVFGVLPWREQGGGFVDRLDGSRDVRLDGRGRACWAWSYSDVIFQAYRGGGDPVVSSGLILVWEMCA